jgi:dihydroorotate dehydrogenase electron transfer subunit
LKQLAVLVNGLQTLAPGLQLVALASPDLPTWRAGQLTLVRVRDSYDPYLRRAHFLAPTITPTPNTVSLISHDDTFAHVRVGDTLDLIVPIGNGFALDASTRRLLLVGAGAPAHLAPLIALAHEATHQQIAVMLLVELAATQNVSWLSQLLPLDVEYQIVPKLSTALPDLLRWTDQLCASLEPPRYASLKTLIADARLTTAMGFAQAVVAPPMVCGFGACLACAVETTRGRPLACAHGPVFDLIDLVV